MKKTLKTNRRSMVDQSFLSLFLTFTFIEFTNRGSGIIDGLFVSNFLDHKYRVTVDDELNVQIEQLSVKDINEVSV